MTIVAFVLLAILLPPVIYDLLFSTNIRRLGLRNVVRRRGEAALVVAGSMLATALITASLIVGDSFGQSIRDLAKDGWGPIDLVIEVDDPADLAAITTAVSGAETAIDGTAAVRFVEVAAGGLGADAEVEPRVRLFEADLAELGAFGGDPDATGFGGLEPLSAGDVVVNDRLADDLGLRVGQPVELFVAGMRQTFNVSAVVDASGMAGFIQMVAAPGAVTGPAGIEDGVENAVIVSNVGDVFTGAERTDAVITSLRSVLGDDIEIDNVKQDLLQDADEEAAETKSLFGTIGGFSVAAGILLVINLFVMLAAERKTELGVLRAVGVKRGHVLRAFAMEGAIYGALAAAIGALLGVGVAAGVVAFASRVFSDGDGFTVGLSVVTSSVVAGAVIGFAISQLTVMLTSIRLTKINIVRALKDLPESASTGHQGRNALIGLATVAIGVGLYVLAGTEPIVAMAAPVIALIGAIPLLGRVLPGRVATIICASAAIAWPALVFSLLPDVMNDPDVSLFLLQGILLVGLATVLVAALAPVWLGLVDRLTGGGVASRLGLAHPLARPVRTALLVAMYSLVIFTVTFMAIMNTVFKASTPTMAFQAGGGYDLVVDASPTAAFATSELLERSDVEIAVPIRTGRVEFLSTEEGAESGETDGYRVSFLPTGFDDVATPELTATADAFDSDAAAWSAIVDGSDDGVQWVAMPDWSELDVGSSATVIDRDGTKVTVRVAGHTDLQWLVGGGVLMSAELADDVLGDQPLTRHYVKVGDGVDPEQVVGELEAEHVVRGLESTTFLSAASLEVQGQEAFLQMLQGYLGLGLLIGIAGLGVVLARAVRERRRQIGMMRAIGFSGSTMRRAFLVEAVFIGFQGVLLGIGLGVLSAWQTLTQSTAFEDNLEFAVPSGALVGLAVVCLGASIAAALSPAIRSGRIAPAVALRH